jgi:hypothetical protein
MSLADQLEPIRMVGVDLGQQHDYTAISVLERTYRETGELFNADYRLNGKQRYAAREKVRLEYHVRHLVRPPLGTSYVDVVERVVELVKALDGNLILAVDQSGVGRLVYDMLRPALGRELKGTAHTVTLCPITKHGGDAVSRQSGAGFRVPKRDVINSALVLFQGHRLKIAKGLELRETLVNELLNYRIKIDPKTAHDSYTAYRDNTNDDLVISVALSCWVGERRMGKIDTIPRPEIVVPDAPIAVYGESLR